MPEQVPARTGDHASRGRVGLVGASRMVQALARGWERPILCRDTGSGRGAVLVNEVGGEVAASNADLAAGADLILLCHKAAQLAAAAEIDGVACAVVSILSGVTVAQLHGVYRRSPVVPLIISLPVEVRAGVISLPLEQDIDGRLERNIVPLFGELGVLIRIPEQQIPGVIALAGIGPRITVGFRRSAVRCGLPGKSVGGYGHDAVHADNAWYGGPARGAWARHAGGTPCRGLSGRTDRAQPHGTGTQRSAPCRHCFLAGPTATA